jgi:hypothetical protein
MALPQGVIAFDEHFFGVQWQYYPIPSRTVMATALSVWPWHVM